MAATRRATARGASAAPAPRRRRCCPRGGHAVALGPDGLVYVFGGGLTNNGPGRGHVYTLGVFGCDGSFPAGVSFSLEPDDPGLVQYYGDHGENPGPTTTIDNNLGGFLNVEPRAYRLVAELAGDGGPGCITAPTIFIRGRGDRCGAAAGDRRLSVIALDVDRARRSRVNGSGGRRNFELRPRVPATAADALSPRQAVAADKRPHVLLVEDDPPVAEAVAELLRDAGVRCDWAPSGEDALRRLIHEPLPALVLLDLLLPGVDGFVLLQRMRSHARLSRVPVCVVSALVQPDLTAPLGDVQGLLAKPIDPDLLLAVVARYCRPSTSRAGSPGRGEPP